LRIAVSHQNEVAVMTLNGKFHAAGDGPYLRQKIKELIDGGVRKLVINFADVPYIDSTGLGFLAGSRITAQNAGVSMVLSNLNPHVRKILDSVRLTDFFTIAADEQSALERAKGLREGPPVEDSSGAKAAKGKRPRTSAEPG
jgi:anti-sigma B factor antagonist